ncbi:MAG: nucleotidyltransferase domain-containing protein [Candidatus Bathyarchaeota archaeon]|nr:nucleotidyltransferase domain-containing protein [Candidatus Bathyarchaeota archaeon]MDH5787064.1 nucleotidyltransferase domain-containing protein [Candidatus Bathyarchaeota archaeon]
MATLRLRDRDAILTREGLILRVFGYSHLPNAYICDAEYASAKIFKSDNPRAFRTDGNRVFYKFYDDEGWKFVKDNFPQYMTFHHSIRKKVVGVKLPDIALVLKPEEEFRKLVEKEPKDKLIEAVQSVLKITTRHSGLSAKNFGVFGSLLHGFYHPQFSDIDLIIYGKENVAKMRETVHELYGDKSSSLKNEFESDNSIKGKNWRFENYTPKEFVWHQRRKTIYALFKDEKSGRIIKTEFEPVKEWGEIGKAVFSGTKVTQKGWVKMFARVTEDYDAPFIPSIYGIKPLKVLDRKTGSGEAKWLISYLEEFRMQAYRDETVYIEGNLEEVKTPEGSFHQITLTYCPRYYNQVLKVAIA